MFEVKMPRLGQTMESGTVTNWYVNEGERVTKGEILLEIQSEKSTIEIEAQESGVVKKILIESDVEVPVNTVIAIIGEEDEEIDLTPYENLKTVHKLGETINRDTLAEKRTVQEDLPVVNNKIQVAPKARRLAKELGVNLESVKGTGKNGIITEQDVRNALHSNQALKIKGTYKLNPIERSKAKNILASWQNIPQFTQMITVNMEKVLSVKTELGQVTLNDIFLKVIGNQVKQHPIVNSKIEDNTVTIYEDVNISVAVNSKNGLVVPVVKHVDQKTVFDISSEVKQYVEKANQNELTQNDNYGGTITVSNLGSFGIESGTPIINHPQSTIIFLGTIQRSQPLLIMR